MGSSWTPESGLAVVQAGVAAASARGAPMAVALVDAAMQLVAFARTPDATGAAVDCAPAKARTAVWFGRPTAEVVAVAQRRPEVYGSLVTASPHPLVLSMGGIPVLGPTGSNMGAVAAAGALQGSVDVEVAEEMLRCCHRVLALPA